MICAILWKIASLSFFFWLLAQTGGRYFYLSPQWWIIGDGTKFSWLLLQAVQNKNIILLVLRTKGLKFGSGKESLTMFLSFFCTNSLSVDASKSNHILIGWNFWLTVYIIPLQEDCFVPCFECWSCLGFIRFRPFQDFVLPGTCSDLHQKLQQNWFESIIHCWKLSLPNPPSFLLGLLPDSGPRVHSNQAGACLRARAGVQLQILFSIHINIWSFGSKLTVTHPKGRDWAETVCKGNQKVISGD